MNTQDVRTICLSLLAVAALAGSLTAHAVDQKWKSATDKAGFIKQADEVRKDMDKNGRYADISTQDRSEVELNLRIIQALFDRREAVSAMTSTEQVDLINAQEKVNALLTKNDGDRLVCTMEARSGTHFKTKQCMTVRERNDLRRKSQESFQNNTMKNQVVSPQGT